MLHKRLLYTHASPMILLSAENIPPTRSTYMASHLCSVLFPSVGRSRATFASATLEPSRRASLAAGSSFGDLDCDYSARSRARRIGNQSFVVHSRRRAWGLRGCRLRWSGPCHDAVLCAADFALRPSYRRGGVAVRQSQAFEANSPLLALPPTA